MTPPSKLNQAEIDILRLICLGMTNKEIAQRLATTVPMVKWRTNQAFAKLDVRNRVQAVVRVRHLFAQDYELGLVPAGPMPEPLSAFERQVLELLAYGLTTVQIASSLRTTSGTVKWYIRELFGKLQVRNRIEALARARQHRWL